MVSVAVAAGITFVVAVAVAAVVVVAVAVAAAAAVVVVVVVVVVAVVVVDCDVVHTCKAWMLWYAKQLPCKDTSTTFSWEFSPCPFAKVFPESDMLCLLA